MICPQCGAVYADEAAFCGYDGTALVPEAAGEPATAEPTQAGLDQPKPKKPSKPATRRPKGALLALVLAIALVVVVAVGSVLVAKNGRPVTSKPKVTGTAPALAEDWSFGVSPSWQRDFSVGDETSYVSSILASAPSVWMVSYYQNTLKVDGINTETGQTLWTVNRDQYLSDCTDTLVDGKWACIDRGASGDGRKVCLVDSNTGDQACIDMATVTWVKPGNAAWLEKVWLADGALIVAEAITATNADYPPPSYWRITRLSLPSFAVEWTQDYNDGCVGAPEPVPTQEDMGGIMANVLWFSGPNEYGPPPLVVDIRNGQQLISTCVGIYPVADGTFMTPPDVPAGPLALPGGGQITTVNSGGAIEYPSGQFPSVPVYYVPSPNTDGRTGYASGTLGAGGAMWPVTLPLQEIQAGQSGNFLVGAASGNTLVVVGGHGQVAAVDCTTGQPIWYASLAASNDEAYVDTNDWTVSIVGNMVVVTTTFTFPQHTDLLSLATGQPIETIVGKTVDSPNNTMLAAGDQFKGILARLVPAAESRVQPPADIAACPSDTSPVSWTKYAAGSILVCGGNDAFQVVSSQGWKASQLDWADDGYTITFSNGNVVRAYLGGSFFTTTKGSKTRVAVASESWMPSTGSAAFATQPIDVSVCGPDTSPIALSTWDGGWVLVCGTSAASPTSIAYKDGGKQGQVPAVTVSRGYCGAADPVCVYRAPAWVRIDGVGHAVDSNFFLGSGGGGAGLGMGVYGVPAPDATAQAQVEYLAALVNLMVLATPSVEGYSDGFNSCTARPYLVSRVQDVIQVRDAMMTAFTSTPIDQIPNGDWLMAQLQGAVQASSALGHAYVSWGQTPECDAQPPQDVVNAEIAAHNAFDTFAATWNNQIAPIYNVQDFTGGW